MRKDDRFRAPALLLSGSCLISLATAGKRVGARFIDLNAERTQGPWL